MTTVAERNEMKDYVMDTFNNLRYSAEPTKNDDIIRVKRIRAENPGEAYVFLHSRRINMDEFEKIKLNVTSHGKYIANIFHEKDYLKGLTDRMKSGKARRSLKKYDDNEIDKMINLSQMEKKVWKMQGNKPLVYFTDDFQSCLYSMQFQPVTLDYSHVDDEKYAYTGSRQKAGNIVLPRQETEWDDKSAFEGVSKYSRVIIPKEGALSIRKCYEENHANLCEMFNIPEEERENYSLEDLEALL